jgi:hypothetical protein
MLLLNLHCPTALSVPAPLSLRQSNSSESGYASNDANPTGEREQQTLAQITRFSLQAVEESIPLHDSKPQNLLNPQWNLNFMAGSGGMECNPDTFFPDFSSGPDFSPVRNKRLEMGWNGTTSFYASRKGLFFTIETGARLGATITSPS